MALWHGRDVISILDFDKSELEELFDHADYMLKALSSGRLRRSLEGRIVSLAFFEPSTRTRMSFESAAKRLGADTIGFTGEEAISVAKGENLGDTVRMLDAYSDLIVIRHRFEGAALYAAQVAENPVINGGDGRQHHPTQAMLDLFTVRRLLGEIDGLTYGVLGDLRYGRAASSFILALTRYKPKRVYLIAPRPLRIRDEVRLILDDKGMPYTEEGSLEDVIGELDVLYVTRIQKERFPDPEEYERVRGSYKVTPEVLKNARRHLKILHPLPRVDEIDPRVDFYRENAAYFTQARYGIPLRMALLDLILRGGD
ncbi:MAG: aspartate carbamoyltransferase [Desulfurococcales archaeon]|nr:aspartate carbamoyltransferase [Desulfurococcales archaeon]